MDKEAHPRHACQLETRQWVITDDNGEVETVNGPGVIGKRCFWRIPNVSLNYRSYTHCRWNAGKGSA